jgi:anti-anti-sigma factor
MHSPSSIASAGMTAPPSLKIEGHLDIQHAEAVQKLLLAQPAFPAFSLDLSAVNACDLTGLQLLLSARHTARDAGAKFSITAPSAAVATACAGLGLDISELSTSAL